MPFNTPQAKAESQRRKRAGEQRMYSELVSLMNDTKWERVFVLLAQRGLYFQLQLVGWPAETFCPLIAPPSVGVFINSPKGYVDGVIGSGFFYRELQSVRCPATISGEIVLSSQAHQQDLAGLAEELRKLGKLPIAECADHLDIHGYQCPTLS